MFLRTYSSHFRMEMLSPRDITLWIQCLIKEKLKEIISIYI